MKKKSQECLTVNLQTNGRAVENGITSICNTAISILQSKNPAKRRKKSLISAVESLLDLQKAVVDKIPTLVPNECTKYTIARLHSTNSHEMSTHSQERPPRENMRMRTFQCGSSVIPLPSNTKHYSAVEVCGILSQVEKRKPVQKNFLW